MIKGLEHLCCEERLGEPGEKQAPGDLTNVYKYLKEGAKSQALLSGASGRTRGNGHKLKPRKFPLNIRKHIFTVSDRTIQKPSGHGPGQLALGSPA